MKKMVCEICGGVDLVKEDGVFTCQGCGGKYSLEEVKKMMVEGNVDVSGSTVKVDTSDELKNLYELAKRARNDGNSTNAQKYYDQILVKDPNSWEAYFYSTFYQSMNCKIGEIGVAANRINNCESTVFELIKKNVTDPEEQKKTVKEIAGKLIFISDMLFNGYKNHYDGISYQVRGRFTQEYVYNCAAARDIVYDGGDHIINIFGDEYGEIAADCWKLGISQHKILLYCFSNQQINRDKINSYVEKVNKFDPEYQNPLTPQTTSSGGCYVATAVYGSYDCPEVWTLRRYRDNDLAESPLGRLFIHTYYAISPTLVKWFGHTEWFKNMWKGKLDRMVKKLQEEGYESTPYEDIQW